MVKKHSKTTKNTPKRDKLGRLLPGQPALGGAGRPKKTGEKLLWSLWDDYGVVVLKQALQKKRSWACRELMKKLFPDRKAQEITGGDKGFSVIIEPRTKKELPGPEEPKELPKPKE